MTDKIANASAAVSTVGATTGISLTQVNDIMSICAFFVAIVSGVFATWYHYKKIKALNVDKNKDRGE